MFVEFEQVLDAVAFAGEWLRAVTAVNGPIELAVGLDQLSRHHTWIVEVGER